MSLCWLRDPFRLRPWLQIRGKSSSACHIWSTSWREERGSIVSAMFCTGQASQHLQWIYRLKGSQGISRDSRVLAQLAVHCRKKWLASISSGQCPSQTRRSHPWAPSSGTHQLWSLSRNIWSLSSPHGRTIWVPPKSSHFLCSFGWSYSPFIISTKGKE